MYALTHCSFFNFCPKGLLLLVVPLSRVLEMTSLAVILQCLRNVIQGVVNTAASPLSAVLVNQVAHLVVECWGQLF